MRRAGWGSAWTAAESAGVASGGVRGARAAVLSHDDASHDEARPAFSLVASEQADVAAEHDDARVARVRDSWARVAPLGLCAPGHVISATTATKPSTAPKPRERDS